MLLKKVRAEESLLSMSAMLSLLTKKNSLVKNETILISLTIENIVGRLDFHTDEDMELYVRLRSVCD